MNNLNLPFTKKYLERPYWAVMLEVVLLFAVIVTGGFVVALAWILSES